MTDSLAHIANLALHRIYSFIYPVQSLSYLTLRFFSSASSRWSNLVLKGFHMLDALKQVLGCNVMCAKNQHKFNCNSVVIIHISAAQLSDLSFYIAQFIKLWSKYFSVKYKQWKSTTQRSLYSTILSHIWCTLHALWDYYLDPYNTINAVEKQKPLAPSRNWISLMSSLAHWW